MSTNKKQYAWRDDRIQIYLCFCIMHVCVLARLRHQKFSVNKCRWLSTKSLPTKAIEWCAKQLPVMVSDVVWAHQVCLQTAEGAHEEGSLHADILLNHLWFKQENHHLTNASTYCWAMQCIARSLMTFITVSMPYNPWWARYVQDRSVIDDVIPSHYRPPLHLPCLLPVHLPSQAAAVHASCWS